MTLSPVSGSLGVSASRTRTIPTLPRRLTPVSIAYARQSCGDVVWQSMQERSRSKVLALAGLPMTPRH